MREISPRVAASLALNVYDVNDSFFAAAFVNKHNEILGVAEGSAQLTAAVGLRLLTSRDGFGICLCGGKKYDNDIFMIFRGTTGRNYGADIVTDFRAGMEKTETGLTAHVGFNHAFKSMLPQIREFLTKNAQASGTVHIIGHSLGGAIATLAADWVSAMGRDVKLYTFGAPKAGLEFFAYEVTRKLGTGNIYRVYHSTDIVPMVPVYPFAHAPFNHWGYQLPSRSLISFAADKMSSYTKSTGNSSWEHLARKSRRTVDVFSVQRWLRSDKPLNPADPKTWEWINAALAWVLRKVIGASAVYLQSPVVSVFSLADKISWMLRKGIDLSVEASGWILILMRKIMQALGMQIVKSASELTQLFMRQILQRLITKMSLEAERAIRALSTKR